MSPTQPDAWSSVVCMRGKHRLQCHLLYAARRVSPDICIQGAALQKGLHLWRRLLMVLYSVWLLVEMEQVLRLRKLQQLLKLPLAQTICKQNMYMSGSYSAGITTSD